MTAFLKSSLTNHKALVAGGAVCLVLVLLLVSVFGGQQGSDGPYSIPAPTQGFDWYFDEDLRVTHIKSGSIPDTAGDLQPVEIVEVELPHYTAHLYLTPDFRFVVFRDAPFGGETDLRTFTWTAEPTPWLFGASEWFGSSVEERSGYTYVQWQNSSKSERIEEVDVSIREGILSVEQKQPFRPSRPPGYASPHRVTDLGDFSFKEGTIAPYKMTAPHIGDQHERDYALFRMETVALARPSVGLPIEGVPTAVESPGLLPVHAPDWEHPFPFQEAWQVLKEEVTLPTGFLITSIDEGNPEPFEAWAGGTAITITLQRTWRWDITVDSPTSGPKTYRVSKIQHAPMEISVYSYRVQEWDKAIENVSEVAIAEKTIPIDLLIEFVEQTTGGDFLFVTTSPNVEDGRLIGQRIKVSLRPDNVGRINFLPFLSFDVHTGNMTQGTLSPDGLDNLLYGGT